MPGREAVVRQPPVPSRPSPVASPTAIPREQVDDCVGLWVTKGHNDTSLDEVAGVVSVHWWSAKRGNRSVAIDYRDPACWENPRTRQVIQHDLESRIYPTGPGDCELAEPEVPGDFVRVYLLKKDATTPIDDQLASVSRPIPPNHRSAPLTFALRELFRGTTPNEKRWGCQSYFDSVKPSALLSVSLANGHAVIDMDAGGMFALGATAATSFMLGQLEPTAFQFPTVNTVELRLDGSCERFGDAVQTIGCVVLTRPPDA